MSDIKIRALQKYRNGIIHSLEIPIFDIGLAYKPELNEFDNKMIKNATDKMNKHIERKMMKQALLARVFIVRLRNNIDRIEQAIRRRLLAVIRQQELIDHYAAPYSGSIEY